MAGNGRLLLRRAHAQQTLLLAVLAVALVGATVLGTFALLLSASQHHLLAVALDRTIRRRSRGRRDPDARTRRGGHAALRRSRTAPTFLDDLLGEVPAAREEWLRVADLRASRARATPSRPYVYLAATPQVERAARSSAGRFPTSGVDDDGRVLVAVPQVAADAYGWSVGTVARRRGVDDATPTTFVVTGTFALTGPSADVGS